MAYKTQATLMSAVVCAELIRRVVAHITNVDINKPITLSSHGKTL